MDDVTRMTWVHNCADCGEHVGAPVFSGEPEVCRRCGEVRKLHDQLDEAVGLLREPLAGSQDRYTSYAWMPRVIDFLNRLDAGEGSNDKA